MDALLPLSRWLLSCICFAAKVALDPSLADVLLPLLLDARLGLSGVDVCATMVLPSMKATTMLMPLVLAGPICLFGY